MVVVRVVSLVIRMLILGTDEVRTHSANERLGIVWDRLFASQDGIESECQSHTRCECHPGSLERTVPSKIKTGKQTPAPRVRKEFCV